MKTAPKLHRSISKKFSVFISAIRVNSISPLLLACFLLPVLAKGQITPPYTVSFESTESFTIINLHGQNGWQVNAGSASVTSSVAFSGTQSVVLNSGLSAASISQSFASFSGDNIIFVDFYAQLVADVSISSASVFNAESSFASLVKVGAQGEVYVSNGDGLGGGTWTSTGYMVPLTTGNISADWVRFTLRLNFTGKKWDLFLDGDLVSYDLGFRDNTKTYLSVFNLTGHTATDGFFDDLYVWTDNPLFTDTDKDGMEDSWETTYGLNTSSIDRDSDLDTDGIKNIDEYRRGTSPAQADTDGDGLTDAVEIYLGSNPLIVDNYMSTLPVSSPRLHLRADSGLVIDSSGYLSQWTDRSGNGYHATQSTAGIKPQVVASQLNGRPVVRFDGTDDYLSLPDLMSGATAGEIVAVIKIPRATNRPDAFWNFGASGDVIGSLYYTDGLHWDDFGSSSYKQIGMPETGDLQAYHIHNTSSKAGEWAHRMNGILRYSTTSNTVAFRTNPSLGYRLAHSHYLQGDIAEILIYDRVLTHAEREEINTYLSTKYNLVSAPNPPANFQAIAINATQAHLAWDAPLNNYSHSYTVEQQIDGVFTEVAEVTDTTSSIIHGLTPGASSVFRVRARNGGGISSPSDDVSVLQPNQGVELPATGIRLWLRADAGVPISGLFAQWMDQSGLNNHASITGVSSVPLRPQIVTDAINGRPVVRFDGANDYLALPNLMSGATAGEIIAVVKTPRTTNRTDAFWNLGASPEVLGSLHHTDGLQWDDFGSSTYKQFGSPELTTLQSYHIHNTSSKTGEWIQRVNGVQLYSSPTNTVAFRTTPSIGYRLAFGHYLQGDIAEIILFDRVLTLAERESVNTYLTRKYDLLAAPPSPSNFKAISISDTQALLAWSAPTSTHSHTYIIEREVSGVYSAIAETTDSTSIIIENLTPGSLNTFRVSARNGAGSSEASNSISAVQPLQGVALPTSGLRLWLRADSGTPASGVLTEWLDQSGLKNHANISGATSTFLRPQIITDAVNGRPVVRFDGTNDYLALPNLMSGATAGEILAVVKTPRTSNRSDAFWNFSSEPHVIGSLYNNDGLHWDTFGTSDYKTFALADLAAIQSYHIHNTSSKAGEWTHRLNGIPRYSTSSNTVLFRTNPTIGYRLAYGQYLQGDIAEILLFDRVLTAPEREAVNTYLARKYDLLPNYLLRTDNDYNGDGLADSIGAQLGYSSTNYDVDADGVSNADEIAQGTAPFRPDTDGDGANDASDFFPLDPTRWAALGVIPTDTSAPSILLNKPEGAILQP